MFWECELAEEVGETLLTPIIIDCWIVSLLTIPYIEGLLNTIPFLSRFRMVTLVEGRNLLLPFLPYYKTNLYLFWCTSEVDCLDWEMGFSVKKRLDNILWLSMSSTTFVISCSPLVLAVVLH